MGDHGVGRALVSDDLGQGAGVHPGQTHDAAPLHPVVETGVRAIVGRIGRNVAEDGAPRRGVGPAAHLFDVFDIGPHIADVREGEGQDLAHVGRVGQDLLIARHGGVEDHLAQGRSDRPDSDSLKDRAVCKRENACGARKNLGRHGRAPKHESSPKGGRRQTAGSLSPAVRSVNVRRIRPGRSDGTEPPNRPGRAGPATGRTGRVRSGRRRPRR